MSEQEPKRRSSGGARKSGGDIFSRLTDPSKYTGAHRQRFDESGKGRGKAGRVENDKVGDLSQLTRPALHNAGTRRSTGTTGIDLSGVQKFGTQATKAKTIVVYTNGDVNHKGAKITLTKALNSMEKLLKKFSKDLTIPTGPCLKVYEVIAQTDGNKHKRVTELDNIKDGAIYIACGAEPVNKAKYPKALLQK